ncbi:hypothetical protein GGI42DRAFT_321767 [Trichoderma sp. SZMC 28013]
MQSTGSAGPSPLDHACSCTAMLAAARGSDRERTMKKSEPSRPRHLALASLWRSSTAHCRPPTTKTQRTSSRMANNYWTGPDGVTGKFA